LNYVLIFLLAVITSTASALVGLGGGLLLIPFIILIFGLPLKYVAGTMLIAMVPYTAVATLRNFKQKYVSVKIGLIMEIGSVIGVISGSTASALIPNLYLKIIFVIIILYLMFTLQIPTNSPYNYIARVFKKINFIPPFFNCKTAGRDRCSIPALIFVGFWAGLFSGLLGIGGGFLKTPVLIVGVLLRPKVAVGTALFMIMITASFGAVNHALLGHIYYQIAAVISLGMMIGAFLGSSFLKRLPEKRIRKYIVIALVVAIVLTFLR
jgi:uncharacterized membrane protein YfcA